MIDGLGKLHAGLILQGMTIVNARAHDLHAEVLRFRPQHLQLKGLRY